MTSTRHPRRVWPALARWGPAAVVAVCAVVATAHGLYEVAAASGVPDWIAWLYPVITDGLALVAYVSTIRLHAKPDRTYAWCVVVLAAGLSGVAQAAYLSGGVTDVSPGLRFGVGAWPAVAAAIVAHLLFLIGHATTNEREHADHAEGVVESASDDSAGADGRTDVQCVHGEPISPTVQADVQPAIQPSVQTSAVQVSRVEPREVRSGRAGGRREQARAVARRFAHEHDRLPTVSELQDAAGVSRGSAHAALKELRQQRAALHIVNDDQEAAQP